MSWRPHSHARVDPRNPQAFGTCDRCNQFYNLVDLKFQRDWRGNQLQNIWLRVCQRCLDIPQEQLRPKVLPADPVPVYQPRTFNFAAADAGGVPIGGTVQVPNLLMTEGGDLLVSDSTGALLVADH